MEGGCTCRQVRYRLVGRPLIVHACHCRWCQRETGTAHALNALYEADRVVHTAGEPELVSTPSASGKGQKIARCPTCQIAIWSNYPQAGPAVRRLMRAKTQQPSYGLFAAVHESASDAGRLSRNDRTRSARRRSRRAARSCLTLRPSVGRERSRALFLPVSRVGAGCSHQRSWSPWSLLGDIRLQPLLVPAEGRLIVAAPTSAVSREGDLRPVGKEKTM